MKFSLRAIHGLIMLALLINFVQPAQALAANPQNPTVSETVVISQVYGGGGNSGATWKNDFIELFNRGTTAVNLSTYSVQYASSTGTSWQRTNLSGSIQPGKYYLIQQAAGTGGTQDLPTPDASGTINLSATTGKIALVSNQTTLSGACPTEGIVDFVGFGAANCYEGAGSTPALTNTTAALRNSNGCTETDDNSADFSTGAPNPRNTSSPTHSCTADNPPSVFSVNPQNGEKNVALDANLTIVFSEPVNFSSSSFSLDCSSGVRTASFSGSTDTYNLNPNSDFVLGDLCTVTIFANQVTDQDKNDPPDTMQADFEWSFSVIRKPLINEFVFNHVETDNYEYVEIYGSPNTDYSAFTILQAEGDSGVSLGKVTSVTQLGSTDAGGYWTTGYQLNLFQNGTQTLLLVQEFSGAVYDDLDTDDDGVLDNTPWSALVDEVAITDGGPTDLTYSTSTLGGGFDGLSFVPGGASRIPNAIDTDSISDWKRNDFDGAGIPALDPGTPTFGEAYNTPGAANLAVLPTILINELDSDTPGTDAAEFIELFDGGIGNIPLDGMVVVFYNGSNSLSYAAYDLDGYSTDANGYFLLGNTGVAGVNLVFAGNFLQNGADAVALYLGNANDFPNNTPVILDNLVDAIAYDTDDADVSGLLVLLNPGQPQVNENGNGDGANHSNQRCPNGSGGARNTDTYQQHEPSPKNANLCGVPPDTAPQVESTQPANGASGVWIGSNIVINFNEDVTVSGKWYNISCGGVDQTAVASGSHQQYILNPDNDLPANTSCTVTIFGAQVVDQDGDPDNIASDYSFSFTTVDLAVCSQSATAIHDIQGSGASSPLVGTTQTIQGIVIASYQGAGELSGFFVQEEDADTDADPTTSEGIFVYSTLYSVNVGDLVRVTGSVTEYFGLTELTSVSNVTTCGVGIALPDPVMLSLPFADETYLEQYEGMRVSVPAGLVVSEVFRLGRGGEFLLASGDRLWQPTNVELPGAPALAMQAANNLNKIIIDDGRQYQNPDPIIHPAPQLSLDNRFRIGDSTAQDITGVLTYSWSGWSGTDAYRIHPETPTSFIKTNPQPVSPPTVGGNLKVASFNVLNYFNGPTFPTTRGASTALEFTRQRDKIIQAILALDADIIGLMEIENDGYGASSAIQDLVNGLNAIAGAGVYAFVTPPGAAPIGTDEIAVGILYKPAVVEATGAAAILDSTFDPAYLDTKSRPALAQTFTLKANNEKFTLVVNHLKSKGSSCNDVGDPDLGDGQGNCNLTRTAAAIVEAAWLATDPTGSGDPDFLIIGDLNSYAMEDPITALKNAGYTDLIAAWNGSTLTYSYVFDGQSGYLDHAMGNSSLAAQVTGVGHFHINTDEPLAFDYNMEFNPSYLYSPDMYRASDHDAVVIGLGLYSSDTYADDDLVCAGNAPCFSTLAQALLHVSDQGTVHIYAGTYAETLNLNRDVNVVSEEGFTVNGYTQSVGQFLAPAGTLVVYGDFAITGGDFDPNSGTVQFAGSAAQTIDADLDFYTLAINNSLAPASGGVSLAQSIGVQNALALNLGLLILGDYHLTLSESCTINGAPSAAALIVPTGTGELRRQVSAPATFDFPIGDNQTAVEYSPLSLEITSLNGSGYVAVSLVNETHPANPFTPRIQRYWALRQEGLSNILYNAEFTYTDGDLDLGLAVESDLHAVRYDGQVWQVFSAAQSDENTLHFDNLSDLGNTFHHFTAASNAPTGVTVIDLQASPAMGQVALTWGAQAALGVDILGFNLMRAESPDGPRSQINTVLIASDIFTFNDLNIQSGISYRYWLEVITSAGKLLVGPVYAAPQWIYYSPIILVGLP